MYSNNIEMDLKFETFKKNFRMVQEHNLNAESTYEMEINEFADWTNLNEPKKIILAMPNVSEMMEVNLLEQVQLPSNVTWKAVSTTPVD